MPISESGPLRLSEFSPVSSDDWRARVEVDLKGADFDRRLVTRLPEGIDLQPLYTSAQPLSDAAPGVWPFVRGTRADATPWDMRQRHAHPDPAVASRQIAEDLTGGSTSISLIFDACIHRAEAPDIAKATDGLAALMVDDLGLTLKHFDPSRHGLGVQAGAGTPFVAAQLAALAQRRRWDASSLRVDLGLDPIGTLARFGRLPRGLNTAWDDAAQLTEWVRATLPGARALGVDTAPWHDGGAHASQELGWAMATGIETLRQLTSRGVPVDDAAAAITFTFSVGTHFFLAIAKLRAARALWARIVKACGGGAEAGAMRMITTTAWRTLTRRDPWVNMLRNTTATFTGAIAGADVIVSSAFDQRIGPTDSLARRVARNTPLILAHESHLHRVADPAGGSWMVESLSAELAEAAWAELQTVEAAGGISAALADGSIAAALDDTWRRRQAALDTRKAALTGISEFADVDEAPVARPLLDNPPLMRGLKARLMAVAPGPVAAALATLARAADRDFDALLPPAAAGATVSELSRRWWPDADPMRCPPLSRRNLAQGFEALRDRADAVHRRTGARPTFLLANLGPVARHTGRSTWAANFLAAGGIASHPSAPLDSRAQANKALADSGCDAVILCGADADYRDIGADVVAGLRAAGAKQIWLAGRPGVIEGAALEGFMHLGVNVRETLAAMLATFEREEVSP